MTSSCRGRQHPKFVPVEKANNHWPHCSPCTDWQIYLSGMRLRSEQVFRSGKGGQIVSQVASNDIGPTQRVGLVSTFTAMLSIAQAVFSSFMYFCLTQWGTSISRRRTLDCSGSDCDQKISERTLGSVLEFIDCSWSTCSCCDVP